MQDIKNYFFVLKISRNLFPPQFCHLQDVNEEFVTSRKKLDFVCVL